MCASSPLFGKTCGKPTTVNQTALRQKHNIITKINLYFSSDYKCLKGIKPTYGWDAKNAALIGSESNTFKPSPSDIKLSKGEFITKAEIATGQ